MRESIHKYFQVGTILWMSWPKADPIDALTTVCRDDYFDAIEVREMKWRRHCWLRAI